MTSKLPEANILQESAEISAYEANVDTQVALSSGPDDVQIAVDDVLGGRPALFHRMVMKKHKIRIVTEPLRNLITAKMPDDDKFGQDAEENHLDSAEILSQLKLLSSLIIFGGEPKQKKKEFQDP